MILAFEVENFRSIQQPVRLEMRPAKLKGTQSTDSNIFDITETNIAGLKTAVLYGANASGKSNIIKAMEYFVFFIQNSHQYFQNQHISVQPFKLFDFTLNQPTRFSLEFVLKKNRYDYTFSADKNKIHEERLVSYTSKKPTELYYRKAGEPINFGSAFKGEKKALESQLLDNQLLLSKGAVNKFEPLMEIHKFFINTLNVFNINFRDMAFTLMESYKSEAFKTKVINFLKIADTGIEDIIIKKEIPNSFNVSPSIPENIKNDIIERNSYKASVVHYSCAFEGDTNQKKISWLLEEESEGTQKLFALAGPIIDILDKGSILVFDEINNSLHPLITRFLVEMFNDPDTNPKGAQLIFSTHDSSLLDTELFRRDQIWLVEKNVCGYTELKSLCQFEVRKDVPLEKWYLSGRFGALPIIANFFDE